jgi:hypothetical protein
MARCKGSLNATVVACRISGNPLTCVRAAEGGGMCDYSLGGLPNRLAVDGEELIVHRFSTHSIGLASQADLQGRIREARQREQSLWYRFKSLFAPASDCPPVRAVCVLQVLAWC